METVLVAPGEGAEEITEALAELGGALKPVRADPVAAGDPPAALAGAIAAYEAQAESLAPAAAIVHGSGDPSLAAVISLVKLGIPVARLAEPGAAAGERDLPGLLADHAIRHDGALAEQVRAWLRI